MWQVVALAGALNAQINIHYPGVNGLNDKIYREYNVTVDSHNCSSKNNRQLNILWSRIDEPPLTSVIWTPNHFVPIIHFQQFSNVSISDHTSSTFENLAYSASSSSGNQKTEINNVTPITSPSKNRRRELNVTPIS